MARVKINLDGLDSKLEKLNTFIDELKDEMIKDDLIQNKNEKLSLDLYKNGMEVNGKKVPEELFNKYKKMYKDYFDKELTDDNHFRIIE